MPFPPWSDRLSRGVARRVAGRLAVLVLGVAPSARGQGALVPALQRPTVSDRDYLVGMAGGGGAALILQWREAWPTAGDGTGAPRMHWVLEQGLSDAPGTASPQPFVGASMARTLVQATAAQPRDGVWTAGVGAAWVPGGVVIRVPVGVSLGHTFVGEAGWHVTPYAHPRLLLESLSCGSRGCGASRGAVALAFDVGVDAQLSPLFGVRGAVLFSGGGVVAGGDRLALGVHFTPPGLRR